MPIKIMLTEKGAGPVIVCDYCGERIERALDANYEWDGEPQIAGDLREVYLVHKKCSEANERKVGSLLDSNELHIMLPYLADNLKVNWEAARKHADEMSQELG
jgi:hypothetical protein